MLFQQISFCQTCIPEGFKHFFKCYLTSSAFIYANYYFIADIKEGVGILAAYKQNI